MRSPSDRFARSATSRRLPPVSGARLLGQVNASPPRRPRRRRPTRRSGCDERHAAGRRDDRKADDGSALEPRRRPPGRGSCAAAPAPNARALRPRGVERRGWPRRTVRSPTAALQPLQTGAPPRLRSPTHAQRERVGASGSVRTSIGARPGNGEVAAEALARELRADLGAHVLARREGQIEAEVPDAHVQAALGAKPHLDPLAPVVLEASSTASSAPTSTSTRYVDAVRSDTRPTLSRTPDATRPAGSRVAAFSPRLGGEPGTAPAGVGVGLEPGQVACRGVRVPRGAAAWCVMSYCSSTPSPRPTTTPRRS
jgi:hypothetical protein